MTGELPPVEHQLADYTPPPDTGLALVYADERMLVVDKPSGLLSVPGRGERMQDCLASRVQAVYPDALIVHRLDLPTSGLLVMGRGLDAQRRLSQLFESRQVHKRYEALVSGLMVDDAGEVDLPLITDWPNRPRQMVDHEHGKRALTRWRVLARDVAQGRTRVSLEPVTGRSHQLRVHMMALGHPILGDTLYACERDRDAAPRLLLHAADLTLPHPDHGGTLALHSAVPF